MYTAAVLDSVSAKSLKRAVQIVLPCDDFDFLFRTKQGGKLPHHMTINMGPLDANVNDPSIDGMKCRIQVSKLVYNLNVGVCASPVDVGEVFDPKNATWIPLRSSNTHPHITCCITPEAKPALSNKMLSEMDETTITVELEQTYLLEATVTICQ